MHVCLELAREGQRAVGGYDAENRVHFSKNCLSMRRAAGSWPVGLVLARRTSLFPIT